MRTRILLFLLALGIALLLSTHARAGERIHSYHHYPEHHGSTTYYSYGSTTYYSSSSLDIDHSCFPYGCGGISGPFTNPNPRKPSDIPACSYGVDDILFDAREGKDCPYKFVSPVEQRIEKSRQKWLREKRRANKKRR